MSTPGATWELRHEISLPGIIAENRTGAAGWCLRQTLTVRNHFWFLQCSLTTLAIATTTKKESLYLVKHETRGKISTACECGFMRAHLSPQNQSELFNIFSFKLPPKRPKAPSTWETQTHNYLLLSPLLCLCLSLSPSLSLSLSLSLSSLSLSLSLSLSVWSISWLPPFGVATLNTRTQDMLRSALSFTAAAAAAAAATAAAAAVRRGRHALQSRWVLGMWSAPAGSLNPPRRRSWRDLWVGVHTGRLFMSSGQQWECQVMLLLSLVCVCVWVCEYVCVHACVCVWRWWWLKENAVGLCAFLFFFFC